MPESPAQEICGFVLEHLEKADALRQARLYRALAAVIGNEAEAARLIALANDLDGIQAQLALIHDRHQQVLFDFKRRTEEGTSGAPGNDGNGGPTS